MLLDVGRLLSCPGCNLILPRGDPGNHVATCPSVGAKLLGERKRRPVKPVKPVRSTAVPKPKKPKKKRRSVWAVSGGGMETNRRRH